MFCTIQGKVLCLAKAPRAIPFVAPWDTSRSPVRLDSTCRKTPLFLQAGVIGEEGRGVVDFLIPGHLESVQRVEIDSSGNKCTSLRVDLCDAMKMACQIRNTPEAVAGFAQSCHNDYQVYSFLYELFGHAAATSFLEQYTEHVPRITQRDKVKLVVLFNHNYIRNIPPLYSLYSDRFRAVEFILPCASPPHPAVFSYAFGSYQYHGMILQYLEDSAGRLESEGVEHIVFIQDDLLLHPAINRDNYKKWLALDNAPLSVSGQSGPSCVSCRRQVKLRQV